MFHSISCILQAELHALIAQPTFLYYIFETLKHKRPPQPPQSSGNDTIGWFAAFNWRALHRADGHRHPKQWQHNVCVWPHETIQISLVQIMFLSTDHSGLQLGESLFTSIEKGSDRPWLKGRSFSSWRTGCAVDLKTMEASEKSAEMDGSDQNSLR